MSDSKATSTDASEPLEAMVIAPDRARRWTGWVTYVLLFLGVAAAFVWLFVQLTLSWKIALGSVAFLMGYMLLMAWWAGRGADTTDYRDRMAS
ncbi:MAG: hypothetical protein QM770_07770 [Tepidisphaeraceae bacterium]